MKNELFSRELVAEAAQKLHIADLQNATIGEALLIAQQLEKTTGVPFIRMDQGSPSLPANHYGIEAEKAALTQGVANSYPPAGGIPQLKQAASEFIKAFINIDLSARNCLPTTGSVAGSFGTFIAVSQCKKEQNKILFIDPGFPIQKSQLRVLGIAWEEFDIHNYRGEALRSQLESFLKKGDIAAIVYSNPNNPAWICLEESELAIIGELATQYDTLVIEDLAYFCMDSRIDLSLPYQAPYAPTVARYTDNYILLLSASKIFSYAGQRIALACVSNNLFERHYPDLAERYGNSGLFGATFTASIMYMITSGCTASTQHGLAEMLRRATAGEINFIQETKAYAERATRMKEIFTRHGFHIVYDYDVTQPVGDGFFFTLGYGEMTSGQLMGDLLCYGVSSISLATTGSDQQGVRACTSRMTDALYPALEERMKRFALDHPLSPTQPKEQALRKESNAT
ncbi:MAG: aminotransferase class I/II-fold pyridoxal phosphate-dependent enzyme [Phocaeicola sp.]